MTRYPKNQRRSDSNRLPHMPTVDDPPLRLTPTHSAIESPIVHQGEAPPHGRDLGAAAGRNGGTQPVPPQARRLRQASMSSQARRRRSKNSRLKASKTNSRKSASRDVLAKKTKLRVREDAARWQDLRAIPVQRRDDRSKHVHHSTPAEITKPRKRASSSRLA